MVKSKVVAFTGAEAASEAMRQINPDVVPAYPITPQTSIMEKFSKFVADGIVDSEIIRVESEHSAMSAAVGASAAGARVMTATASAGLALMFEILGIASGSRLPIVMSIVNRALSGPINIHCDHSDSMACRDSGWIQIYSENAQEVYENLLLAIRLSEHKDILLPVMVCQDGFITSHGVENVKIYDDKIIKKYVGDYKPHMPLLDVDNPITVGPLQLQDYYFETKRQEIDAMEKVRKVYLEIGKELSKITGNNQGYFEEYNTKDADAIIVVLNSTAGTTKVVVDKMRKEGKKVGLLKPKLFRPFPYKEIGKAISKAKVVGVLDRSESYGANAPLFTEIMDSLYDAKEKPKLYGFGFGFGGRDITEKDIEDTFNELLSGEVKTKYIGVR